MEKEILNVYTLYGGMLFVWWGIYWYLVMDRGDLALLAIKHDDISFCGMCDPGHGVFKNL